MKYIDADKLKEEIDKVIEILEKTQAPKPLGTIQEYMIDAEVTTLGLVKSIIDYMAEG